MKETNTTDVMSGIEAGLRREETMTADEAHLANAVGSGLLPVFATPAMTALMEQAAATLLEERLPEGWTSVGIALDIEHTSATPEGMKVRAEAEVTAVEGRKATFAVRAFDEAGEIGRGTHVRFVVDAARFMEKAAAKRGARA